MEKNIRLIRIALGVVVLVFAVSLLVQRVIKNKSLLSSAVSDQEVMDTGAAGPLKITTPSERQEVSAPAGFSVVEDDERGVSVLKQGDTIVGELPNGWGTYKTKAILVTDAAIYLANCPREVNGYMLFGVCPRRIFQLNRATNELRNTVNGARGNLDMAEDISPDETKVALGRSDKAGSVAPLMVVVRSIAGDTEHVFPVASGYNQLGDIHFSPDGEKLAYAVALGRPRDEAGAVFMIDLKTGVQSQVAKTTTANSYFRIKGWKNNQTVNYEESGL